MFHHDFFVLSFLSTASKRQALPRSKHKSEQVHLLPVIGIVGISIFPRSLDHDCFAGCEASSSIRWNFN